MGSARNAQASTEGYSWTDQPIGCDGSRYVQVYVYEKNGNVRGYGMKSKHSSWSAQSFQKYVRWCKQDPRGFVSGDDKELHGEFDALLKSDGMF